MKKTKEQKEDTRTLPFMLGADPEFLMFHESRALDASGIIKNFFSNTNLRSSNMGYFIEEVGELGWDGASSTAEIRPNASKNPEELKNNIGKLLETMHNKMPFLDFTTLSIGSPIGGHIHVDVPVKNMGREMGITIENTKERNRIIKLMATFIMPIIASEHRISSNGRLRSGTYGKADDIRWDNRNETNGSMEIRGISAEWICSPKIAKATLSYIAVVMNEIINHNKELIKEPVVLKTKGHIDAIQQLMLSDYTAVETAVVKSMAKLIRKFELYPQFKEEVEFILHPKNVLEEKEKAGWNIAKGWNFKKSNEQPTKKDILCEKKISEKLKTTENISIEENFGIPFNNDYNVSLFAKSIADRIVALNWELKNQYFLFGLKKGIEGYVAMQCENKNYYVIPTNVNETTIASTTEKMRQKFELTMHKTIKIDPKNGGLKRWGKNQIVIGIPYNPRAENNTKSLINLVWDIEKKKINAKPLKEFECAIMKEQQKEIEEIIGNCTRRVDGTIVTLDNDTLQTLDNEPLL